MTCGPVTYQAARGTTRRAQIPGILAPAQEVGEAATTVTIQAQMLTVAVEVAAVVA